MFFEYVWENFLIILYYIYKKSSPCGGAADDNDWQTGCVCVWQRCRGSCVVHQQSLLKKGDSPPKVPRRCLQRVEEAALKMEVDEDVEAGLLRQFNCMLTTDKEVLIKELQTLVGAHLNEHTARFYLEMNDW